MQPPSFEPDQFERFQQSLMRLEFIEFLREGLIGENAEEPGSNGPNPLIYADYVESGHALRQVEAFIQNEILLFYANSHTEALFCGQMVRRLRQRACELDRTRVGGDDRHNIIFTGSGATACINRLLNLLGVALARPNGSKTPDQKTIVLIGPYEHHSNILPWREAGVEVVEIPECERGGPDIAALEDALRSNVGHRVIGAFSAMSNVTGIVTDVKKVTRLLNAHGAISIWDYAGGAPYLEIDMAAGTDAAIDAVVVSPHKFIGGPGATGVLVLSRQTVVSDKPSLPGGGTVRFVSPWAHDYSSSIVAREEAGTPNVVGDLRAALCFVVKDAIGLEYTKARLEELRERAETVWSKNPNLQLLGNLSADRMPVFSFKVTGADGETLHQQLVMRMLSDLHGVQARGGCACAGPYAHRLLGIDRDESEAFRAAILSGRELEKPGWTRLGFSVLMTDLKVERIIHAVDAVASLSSSELPSYKVDESSARFSLEVA
jgi:selenocysteine lyase/cysteine desulfurase